MNTRKILASTAIFLIAVASSYSFGEDYQVNFKGADIKEFINAVGKNLDKTIIIDPNVQGTVNIRSNSALTPEQYYHFFQSVLSVYGYSIIDDGSGILKVVPSKSASNDAVPVLDEGQSVSGEEIVSKVISVKNVSASALAPLLRQLIDEAGADNVVHYEPSNVIMLTGRASVVNRLQQIISKVDQVGQKDIEVIPLENALSSKVVGIINELEQKNGGLSSGQNAMQPTVVADDRSNAILVSGDAAARKKIRSLVERLDHKIQGEGNSKVFYLQYAKASNLVNVLKGVSDKIRTEDGALDRDFSSQDSVQITADDASNALVVIAPPDIMRGIEDIVRQLDIRRAQVLIEAMIVEIADNKAASLGVQWGHLSDGIIQFPSKNAPLVSSYLSAQQAGTGGGSDVFSSVNGIAVGLAFSNWNMLVNAISSDGQSNILASPSLVVMDNEQASFIVGEEVPVITGERLGDNNSNPFQTIERKDVGIKLKITPQINEGSVVMLNLEQEISNVIAAQEAVDVRFAKRELKTTVVVDNQQMIVLSGLLDERTATNESKVPILGDVPVIGNAFKSRSAQKERRNLMLFLKPTILRDDVTLHDASRKKYMGIRAEQQYGARDELPLLPGENSPVLPPFEDDIYLPPEVELFMWQMGNTD